MTTNPISGPSTAAKRRRRPFAALWAVLTLAGVLAGCDKADIEAALNPKPATTTTTTTPVRKHQNRAPSTSVPSASPTTVLDVGTPAPTSPSPTSPGPTSPTPTTPGATTPPTTAPATNPGTGCSAVPSRCGYPDATNSGVPAGTTLKRVPEDISSGPGWTVDPRGWIQVDTAGTVIDGITTKLSVEIFANNVTVKNSVIQVGFDDWAVAVRHVAGAVVDHNTLRATNGTSQRGMVGVKTIYGDERNTTVTANNISNFSNGVQIYSGLIQDNYIHDMGYVSGDHVNGTTSNGGVTDQLNILHNTVFNQYGQTDAISLFEDFGVEANRRIENNLVAGGGYTIYGGANPGGSQTSNIKITGNRFSRMFFPNSGSYGPATAFDRNGPGNVWSGNLWDDTGATLPAP